MATKKNIGQILVDKAKEIDSTFKEDNKDDMGEALKIILDKVVDTITADADNVEF